MTGLGGLIAHLEVLRDRLVEDPAGEPRAFRFGARDLVVEMRDNESAGLTPAGLIGASASDPPAVNQPARLLPVSSTQLADLPFPVDAQLAPYGALTESVGTDWLILHSPDARRFLALDRRQRIALTYPGDRIWPRERAEFCRPLLHWLAILDGNVIVHAGAVARDGQGLLVAGAGNAGKSTLTRALLAGGYDFLGDNVVEVGRDAAGAAALFAAYPTVKVRPNGVLPIPDSWPVPEWDDGAQKQIYFLGASTAATAAVTSAPSSASFAATLILDERLEGGIRPISRGSAFFKVAPNTVAQFPFFEQEVLQRAGAAVGASPAFESGRLPLDRMVASVDELLDEMGAHREPAGESTHGR